MIRTTSNDLLLNFFHHFPFFTPNELMVLLFAPFIWIILCTPESKKKIEKNLRAVGGYLYWKIMKTKQKFIHFFLCKPQKGAPRSYHLQFFIFQHYSSPYCVQPSPTTHSSIQSLYFNQTTCIITHSNNIHCCCFACTEATELNNNPKGTAN